MDSKFSYLFQELELKKRIFYCAGQWYWRYLDLNRKVPNPAIGIVYKESEKTIFRKTIFRHVASKYKHLLDYCLRNKQLFIANCACLCNVGKGVINRNGSLRLGNRVISFSGIKPIEEGELFTYDICDYDFGPTKYNRFLYDHLLEALFPDDISTSNVNNVSTVDLYDCKGLLSDKNIMYLYKYTGVNSYKDISLRGYGYYLSIYKVLSLMSKKNGQRSAAYIKRPSSNHNRK